MTCKSSLMRIITVLPESAQGFWTPCIARPRLSPQWTVSQHVRFSRVRGASAGQHPLKLLVKHPDILSNLGETSVTDSAEYGDVWVG